MRDSSWLSNERSAFCVLVGVGVLLAGLTVAAPFAFEAAGDNAFIVLTVPAGLLAIAATRIGERLPTRALWLILGLALALRVFALWFEPLLSTDIYRYIWDGKVQAAGINPYRYVPADPVLSTLRDAAIFPQINRADYAVTIYPPVAEFFFLVVTRFGTSTTVMRLALLGCEAASVGIIMLLLVQLRLPVTRVVAYVWHPLPIWEIANSGHVDALMVFLMLLALLAALGGRPVGAAIFAAAAALTKPFAAPSLAVIWRPWNWRVLLAAGVVLALCYAPYLSAGWNVLGFLTQGYLNEEGFVSGEGFWLLSTWRFVFGAHQGDVTVYVLLAAAIMIVLIIRVWRRTLATPADNVAALNMLLLAVLVLSSPNYPWYFLAIMPFVALCGNPSTWAASIGALLLTDEIEWDFHVPTIIMKSVLFGSVLLASLWSATASRPLRDQTKSQ